MKWFPETKDTLEQSQKGYDATIKRAVKPPIGMSDFFKKQAN